MNTAFYTTNDIGAIADHLQHGAVGILPTDTVYGIVCSARNEAAVGRLYKARLRDEAKPCIILIPSQATLTELGVILTQHSEVLIREKWPGPVSIVFSCGTSTPSYLDRHKKTLACRMPDDPFLTALLEKTGPLLAPSANPQGQPSAKTVEEAWGYFGNTVNFYVDGGVRNKRPSTILMVGEDGIVTTLRT